MNQDDFNKAFELFTLGVINKRGEVEWIDEHGYTLYILFPINNSPNHAIVYMYWKNGNKLYKSEYINGQLNGKESWFLSDGTKYHEVEYRNGECVSVKGMPRRVK